MPDFLIRPICDKDFADFRALAFTTRGMTSLPRDEKLLKKKIKSSLRGFEDDVQSPGGESYLFALFDLRLNKFIGVSGIISKVGGFEPFYSYRIRTETLYSKALKVKKDIKILSLNTNHNGPTEICSLLLSEDYRGQGVGRLLSLCRFLFIAEFRERFDKEVISEMRGVIGPNGNPPFWDCVGRHFFDTDFFTADHLCSLGRKDFIAELMPKHPLYFDLLTQAAKDVIGQVHKDTVPARKLLEHEGMRFIDEVDIFDAGPTMKASVDSLRIVRESKKAKIVQIIKKESVAKDFLVSNTRIDFRCTVAKIAFERSGGAVISEDLARALNVLEGQEIRFVPAK